MAALTIEGRWITAYLAQTNQITNQNQVAQGPTIDHEPIADSRSRIRITGHLPWYYDKISGRRFVNVCEVMGEVVFEHAGIPVFRRWFVIADQFLRRFQRDGHL